MTQEAFILFHFIYLFIFLQSETVWNQYVEPVSEEFIIVLFIKSQSTIVSEHHAVGVFVWLWLNSQQFCQRSLYGETVLSSKVKH